MKQKEKRRVFHLKRAGLFATLLIAFFIVRLDAGSLPKPLMRASVLAFATEMGRGGLLSGTNAARGANGLGGLTLDSQLNSAAQMKAEHMAAQNYWAHVAPDGTQPWYFFDQAGYKYIRAGENLAYGFSTSQGAIDGWMNSPTHRDNMLGNYNDVGFGIANVADYQSSGQQTIVVAHYGSRQNAVAAAPASPTPPPVAPPTTSNQQSAPTPAPEAATPSTSEAKPNEDTEVTVPANQSAEKKTDTIKEDAQIISPLPVQTGTTSKVSVLGMLAGRNLSLAATMSLVLVVFSVAGYAVTHRAAFRHAVISGEQFAVHHPGIDTTVIAAMSALILLTTYGSLQ